MENSKVTWKETFVLNKRALRLWWSKQPWYFVSMGLMVLLETLLPYITVYFSAQIINELTGAGDRERLLFLVLLLLGLETGLGIMKACVSRWYEAMKESIRDFLDVIYNEKMLSLDFAAVDCAKTQDLRTQIFASEMWSAYGLSRVLHAMERLLRAVMGIIGAGGLAVSLFTSPVRAEASGLQWMNWSLYPLFFLVFMAALALLSAWLVNRAEQYHADYREEAGLGNRIFGFFGYLGQRRERALDIRMYEQEKVCGKMHLENNAFGIHSKIAAYAKGPIGMLSMLSDVVNRVFVGVVYLFVCLKAYGGAFGVGSVTQYISAVTMFYQNICKLVEEVGEFRVNTVFLRTCFEFLDIPNEMYKGSLTVEKRSDCNYEVEFCHVSFRYPDTEVDVLKDVNLKFKVGEKLAIVGENGSGKSTFIKLLCRLYDPTEGEIRLNGIDIRKYDYKEYMSVFSVVFQDYKLLAFSLGTNVAAGEQYDAARVEECLDKAGFTDRKEKMKSGLNTYLYKDFSEDGVDISGGEEQKIAIARALYQNAAFLILDEPTAALDPIAEYEIYTRLNDIVGDRTAIYISHRLSSCKFCDEIVVFDRGHIVQQGSHRELVGQEDGKYYALWNAQAQYYVEHGGEEEETLYHMEKA